MTNIKQILIGHTGNSREEQFRDEVEAPVSPHAVRGYRPAGISPRGKLVVSNQPPPPGRGGVQPDATAPDGSGIRLLIDDRHGATRGSLVVVTLPAGQVSRPVWHRTVEEVWYVLEGRGRVWRCPAGAPAESAPPVDVSPGDALAIPTGWRSQFSSAPETPLRFLCFTTPPWPGADEAVLSEDGGLGQATV